jgi:hypothetical protein
MKEFEKSLEEEKKERMPKLEEGKEATEEQKREIEGISLEFNSRKIRRFEEFLKEAETFVYNTNVFKKVNLALSEEELKKEEDKVLSLARYIKETALP